ncbi:MAG TPA: amidohydrolase family protein [Methylomirabilota bacterium]|nr:amidohydrolase family protein [Methylomirabilota bacterium]
MERTILTGAMLFDGSGTPPVAGRAVVVENGRITAVVGAAEAPSGTTLRLGGLMLLPGLINCHAHLCFGGEADPAAVMARESYATTVIRAVLRARQNVEAGVTTVRDLGGRDYAELAVRDAIRLGLLPGPRLLCAGRGVCMTGGHGWNMIGRQADGPDDVRKAVREQLRAGADVIKIFATGGVMTPGVEPGSAQLTLDEVRAGIEEARKAGRRTAAHAMGSEGIANCLEGGITTIEHGVFLTEALCERMARDGVALVPTLIAPHAIAAGGLQAGIPEFAVRKSLAVRDRHLEGFRLALRAGVPIAAGTDAGTPLNPHGSLVPELDLMIKGGMAPPAALQSATVTAARVLGLEHETGRVAPGLAADLLAVAGDPLERIQALDEVRLVMAQGRVVVDRLASR